MMEETDQPPSQPTRRSSSEIASTVSLTPSTRWRRWSPSSSTRRNVTRDGTSKTDLPPSPVPRRTSLHSQQQHQHRALTSSTRWSRWSPSCSRRNVARNAKADLPPSPVPRTSMHSVSVYSSVTFSFLSEGSPSSQRWRPWWSRLKEKMARKDQPPRQPQHVLVLSTTNNNNDTSTISFRSVTACEA